MKKFLHTVKSKRVWKRVTCMVLSLVMVCSLLPQDAEAWEKGTSDGVYKVWEWKRTDMFESMPTGQGYTRVLLVWTDSDGNTWSTANFKCEENPVTCKSPWGHDDHWWTITGTYSDSMLQNKDLKTFITETDLGTLICDVNLYGANSAGVQNGRACIQISQNNSGSKGKEIRCTNEQDSFDWRDPAWDCTYYAGYSLTCYSVEYNGGKQGYSSSNNGTTYILHPGYTNGDNDQFFINGKYVACDGKATYGTDNIEKGTKFTVYFGKQVDYSVLDSTTVLTNNVYKVDSHTFISGTVTVEPGAVLSIEGKCFLNGNIVNYGTLIIQNGGMLCPYCPPDSIAVSGTVYNYGSQKTYKSVTKNNTANGQPGEGIMIIMPEGVFAQTADYGDLYFEKSAMLENHGTMLLARSLVAKQAQISNMSTGRIYFGRSPYEKWIPSLDGLGSKANDYAETVWNSYYYLTEDEDSYFDNAGTWDTSSSQTGEQRTAQTNKKVISNREAHISDGLAKWEEANKGTYLPKTGQTTWSHFDRVDIYYTADTLRAAVERAAAKKSVYDKMADYGLITNSEKSDATKRYTYLKDCLDKYETAYQTELERLQQEAVWLYPFYSAVSTLDLQQQEVEFFRSNYIKYNTMSIELYANTVKGKAETKKEELNSQVNEYKSNYARELKSSADYHQKYHDKYDALVAEYENYLYGEYQETMNVIEQYSKGNKTELENLYATYAYEVELEAWSIYPDVDTNTASASAAAARDEKKTASENASEIANCKAYFAANYKDVTEYRTDLLDTAEERLYTMTERDAQAHRSDLSTESHIRIGEEQCKLASYQFFGYPADWDSEDNQECDEYDVQNKRHNYDGIWTNLEVSDFAAYARNEVEDYQDNTYEPLKKALSDEETLASMYQAFIDDLLDNAKTLYPNADAQSIFDTLYGEKPTDAAAVTTARADYVDKYAEIYQKELSELRTEEDVAAEIKRLEEENKGIRAEHQKEYDTYDDYVNKLEQAWSAYYEALNAAVEMVSVRLDNEYYSWYEVHVNEDNYHAAYKKFHDDYFSTDEENQYKAYRKIIEEKGSYIDETERELEEFKRSNSRALSQSNLIRANEANIAYLKSLTTQEDYLAVFEMDARIMYPGTAQEEGQAMVETYRARYARERQSQFYAQLNVYCVTNGISVNVVNVNELLELANEQIAKEAKEFYPDYYEGYQFPTGSVKLLANNAGNFSYIIYNNIRAW